MRLQQMVEMAERPRLALIAAQQAAQVGLRRVGQQAEQAEQGVVATGIIPAVRVETGCKPLASVVGVGAVARRHIAGGGIMEGHLQRSALVVRAAREPVVTGVMGVATTMELAAVLAGLGLILAYPL